MKEFIDEHTDVTTNVLEKNGFYYLSEDEEEPRHVVDGFHTGRIESTDETLCIECAFDEIKKTTLLDDLPDKFKPIEEYIYSQKLEDGEQLVCDLCERVLIPYREPELV